MKNWNLIRGGEIIATLHVDGTERFVDYQAVEGSYQTTPAFEPVRRLFEREAELLNTDEELENAEWLEIWDQLQAPGLFVESSGGRTRLALLWIHFKEGRAWWFPLYNHPQTKLTPLPNPGKEA